MAIESSVLTSYQAKRDKTKKQPFFVLLETLLFNYYLYPKQHDIRPPEQTLENIPLDKILMMVIIVGQSFL